GLRMSAFAALVSSPSGKISDIFTTPWLVVEAMLDDCPAQGFPAPLPLFGQKTDDRPLALLLQPETGRLDLLRQGQGRKFLFQHVLARMRGHPGAGFRNLFFGELPAQLWRRLRLRQRHTPDHLRAAALDSGIVSHPYQLHHLFTNAEMHEEPLQRDHHLGNILPETAAGSRVSTLPT